MSSCETIDHEAPAQAAMAAAIRAEQPGNYFVGRRMFKKDYKTIKRIKNDINFCSKFKWKYETCKYH